MKDFLYYKIKPFIPRSLQIQIRRIIARRKFKKHSHIWPIDERAGKPPKGWQGWPEGKKFALVLTHDVESEKGLKNVIKLAKLEESMGFRSSFNFVAEDYKVPQEIIDYLKTRGFEIGLHGLKHDGNIFRSYRYFKKQVPKINEYLKKWGAVGFRAPSMYHNLEWVSELNIEYDSSTFDTDPFEPQPDGVGTIFPFLVPRRNTFNHINKKNYINQINQVVAPQHSTTAAPQHSTTVAPQHSSTAALDDYFVELPYTLPQDHLLFILLQEKEITIWKKKLEWIVEKGGMALLGVHPDYLGFGGNKNNLEEYPLYFYENFLKYIRENYYGQYWNTLSKDIANYYKNSFGIPIDYNFNNKKIRVCMLAYTIYEFDGRVRKYVKSLAESGNEVDIICLEKEGVEEKEKLQNIKIYKIQRRIGNEKGEKDYLFRVFKFYVKSAFFLTWQYLRKKYELIHVHNMPDFLVFAAIIPKILGAKIILDIHDIIPELYLSKFNKSQCSILFKALRFLEKMSCLFSDHIIVSNHIWGEKLTNRSTKKEKLSVILNYPEERLFSNNLNNYKKTKRDKIILIYPGTLNWHQGVDLAVKALALLKDMILNHLELQIYGEGPEKIKLFKYINELKLNGKVKIKKSLHINQIAKIMANADIGIVPKRNDFFGGEAFSTKILEFMALGIPVIVSRTKIDSYYFNDSIVKFFEPDNEKDLARCIQELARDEVERKRLATNALEFVKDYTWSKRKQEYLSVVYSLINRI